jgi:prephenate dehydrogenase
MASEEPPFEKIAIVGFGLIGGSIALAIRERWPSIRITAVDGPAVLAHAAGSGALDRAAQRVADLGGNDLVILAAPIEQNIRLLPETAAALGDNATITDVGGTKRDIVRAAHSLRDRRATFVGGHPIGGAEHGGFAFARADLFRGRPWILTPNGSTPQEAIAWRVSSRASARGRRQWAPTNTIG